eukprot:1148663-Pelagomonas_calceolata.AAC.17
MAHGFNSIFYSHCNKLSRDSLGACTLSQDFTFQNGSTDAQCASKMNASYKFNNAPAKRGQNAFMVRKDR